MSGDVRYRPLGGAILVALALLLWAGAGAARADWSGDQHADVLTIHPDGRLLMYRGNGAGGWITGAGQPIGSGWQQFTAFLAPGDWSGDGKPDVLVRGSDGRAADVPRQRHGRVRDRHPAERSAAAGSQFTALLAPRDFNGDGKPDILARTSAGALLMYRGDGDGGWMSGTPTQIGSGWQGFSALLAPGDWSGDGKPDVLARTSAGALLLYRGNGAGGWIGGAEQIGSGWQQFDALVAGGDFSGDGKPDVLARTSAGALLMYRGERGRRVGDGPPRTGRLRLGLAEPPDAERGTRRRPRRRRRHRHRPRRRAPRSPTASPSSAPACAAPRRAAA